MRSYSLSLHPTSLPSPGHVLATPFIDSYVFVATPTRFTYCRVSRRTVHVSFTHCFELIVASFLSAA